MKWRNIFCLLLCCMATVVCQAQQMATHTTAKETGGYNYYLFTPADTVSSKPLVVFLHGASLCGTNLERVKRYGPLHAINKGRKIDALVLAPQNPGGAWNPQKVMKTLEEVLAKHSQIDTTRMYVIGMSLGGYGTLSVAAAYPEKFAAAMAICGGGSASQAEQLKEIPLWILHGTADAAVGISNSTRVVNAINKINKDNDRLIFTKLPGVNHSYPGRILYMPDTYKWLFSHSLSDENRPVNRDIIIDNTTIRGAYVGLHR